jgi:hypothetical protein
MTGRRGPLEHSGGASLAAYGAWRITPACPSTACSAHARADTLAAIIETRSIGCDADPVIRLEWLHGRRVLSLLSDRSAG